MTSLGGQIYILILAHQEKHGPLKVFRRMWKIKKGTNLERCSKCIK